MSVHRLVRKPRHKSGTSHTRNPKKPNMNVPACVRLWIANILLGHAKEVMTRSRSYRHDDSLHVIGLGHWMKMDFEDVNMEDFMQELQWRQEALAKEARTVVENPQLKKNLKKIARLLNLTAVDLKLLEFSIYVHTETALQGALDLMGEINGLRVYSELAEILDLPEMAVRESLSFHGVLGKTGMLEISRRHSNELQHKISLFSETFADRMIGGDVPVFDLLKDMVALSSEPRLDFSDYEHIKQPLDLLLPYLKQALKQKKRGVNFLIHGHPGTGKTQLVKVLAKSLKVPLYEVAFEDERGAPVLGSVRLKSCSVAQHFFSRTSSLLMFDEVEDIFNDGSFGSPSTAQLRKAWLNRNLEENAVPTFWVSNSIRRLDPAFIRRFDMVFEIPTPPREQRERMIRREGEQLLDEDVIKRMADHEKLSPAVVTQATTLVRSVKKTLPKEKWSESVEFLVSNTLEAQGYRKLPKSMTNANGNKQHNIFEKVYNTDYINTDTDISQLADGLKDNPNARICFYGPPGTGKTEFGRWLAKVLDKKLVVKRVSDLVTKWVGETEQNIAKAFSEAGDGKSILLIDEVDSFLQDRRKADQPWEITRVNEMLVQMEQFNGIFIASTNLVDNLDQASLRRFDLKVKFDYLKPEQAVKMLESYATELLLPAANDDWMSVVMSVNNLAAGDFTAVVRQHRFKPFQNVDGLAQAVVQECRLKEGGAQRRIGFV